MPGPLRRWFDAFRESAIRALLSGRGVSRVVNGIPLRVDPVGRQTFTPTYDAGATDYLRRELRDGMEAWNVGANVGVYTLQLAHWVGATGRVVAFEPNPEARAVLMRNVALNGLQSRVEIVPSAVGGAVGSVDFFTAGADGMGRAGRANPLLAQTSRIQVPVTTLDDFAAARGRKPDLIVMDVEGWEIAALHGGRSLMDSTRFVVELHPDAWKWSGHTRADLQAILDEAGLDAKPVSGQSDPLGDYGQVVLTLRVSQEKAEGRRENGA
jgi:FkbM family methyltransferase